MTRDTVLVLGDRLQALTATRSLAAAGFGVIAGDGGDYSAVRFSRYCDEVWRHPPKSDGESFITALSVFLEQRTEVKTILPLQEQYAIHLATNRDRLPRPCVMAMPDLGVMQACLDKGSMYEIAREVGVPHRRVVRATDVSMLAEAAADLGYPCVIRPTTWTGPLSADRKAVICRDAAALERYFPTWPTGQVGLLVQQYVDGFRNNVYFVAHEGRILGRVQTRILRTDRLDGTGLVVEGVTVAPDPRLVRYCDALIDRLQYTGVGTAQFLVPAQGAPHFLEINPRHGGAYRIAEEAGLPLTIAAIDLARGEGRSRVDPGFRYPIGTRYVWTSFDLYRLGLAMVRSEISARSARRWLCDALRAAIRADVHLTWDWRDPMPTFATYAHLATLGPWRRARSTRRGISP